MKPKYLFMCKIADQEAKSRLERYVDVVEVDSTRYEDVLANVEGKDGLVVPYTDHMLVDKAVLEKGSGLKLVGSTYGGVRQNIDADAAMAKGLTVIHTGASRPRPMAEYALALTLSSLLQIHNYHHYMRSGEAWPRGKYPRTKILFKRKVGVAGLGRIGRGIVELFKCFTDEIAVFSRHLSAEDASALGVEKMELDELFASCEIVLLAGGYTKETHHMVGAKQFELMPDGALFVNIARGGMVDQKAMIEAVQRRDIYLALDVFENEPLEADSPLRGNDRVLITPHRANNSIEFERRWQCLADEIERFATGLKPESALSPERAGTMSES